MVHMKKKDSDGAKRSSSSSIYLFYGDEYLVKNAARDFCANLTGKNEEDAAFVVFDGVSLDYGRLVNEVSTPSLFCPKKVILIDQASFFVGRSNVDKLVNKTCESWRAGEKKSSLRSFAQLLALANIQPQTFEHDASFVEDLASSPLSDRDKQTLSEIAGSISADSLPNRHMQDDSVVLKLISSPLPPGVTLVCTATVVDKKQQIYKALEKYGNVTELAPVQEKYSAGLQRNYFSKLVNDFLARHGKKIAPEALNKMYDRSGKDIRRIHSELGKMIAFIGDRAQITVKDVEDLFLDFHEPMFFDLLSVLRTSDPVKCLPALHDNLKLVSHPLQTLAAITSEFRKIIVAREMLFTVLRKEWRSNLTYDQFVKVMTNVRSTQIRGPKKSKFDLLSMKDYPLYLLLKNAQNYTMDRLTAILEAILEAETLMKSTRIGSISPDSVMQDLVLKICRPSQEKSPP